MSEPEESNVGPMAQAHPPASRRKRKQVPLKQRVAELEETVHILGLAVLTLRGVQEQLSGRAIARQILPRG